MHIIHARIFTISSGSAQVGLLAVGKSIEATFGLLCKWDRGGGGRRESGKPTWLGFPLGFWAYVVGEDERKRGKEGAYVSALRSIRWFSLDHSCLPCTEEKAKRESGRVLLRGAYNFSPFRSRQKFSPYLLLKKMRFIPPSLPLSSPLLGFGSLPPPPAPQPQSVARAPETTAAAFTHWLGGGGEARCIEEAGFLPRVSERA